MHSIGHGQCSATLASSLIPTPTGHHFITLLYFHQGLEDNAGARVALLTLSIQLRAWAVKGVQETRTLWPLGLIASQPIRGIFEQVIQWLDDPMLVIRICRHPRERRRLTTFSMTLQETQG